MIQKSEAIHRDEIWFAIKFWAVLIFGVTIAVVVGWFIPLGGFLGYVALPVGAGIVVWAAGYWKGILSSLAVGLLLVGGTFILSAWTRDFGYNTMVKIGEEANVSESYPRQPLRILVNDEGACIDAKGVQWDGTPVTVYSSASGTVEIENTCRLLIQGAVEIRDTRSK